MKFGQSVKHTPAIVRSSNLVASALAIALGLWIAISAFQPFTPSLPQLGLDASWGAAMGQAADRGLNWGPDIAFTYGPASTLVTGYFNTNYLNLTLPLLLATCVLLAMSTILLVRPRSLKMQIALAVATGLIAAFSTGYPDCIFLVLPLLPFLLVLSGAMSSPAELGIAGATALAIGMIGMAKMSFPLSALPLFLLGDIAAMLRRCLPVLTACCVLGFLGADLLYGQSFANLPQFIRQQGEMVAGYSEAMSLDGSRGEVVAFLLASAALVTVTAAVDRTLPPSSDMRQKISQLSLSLGLAWVLLLLFKAGFVRQDMHTLIAWFGLALAGALIALVRLRTARPRLAVGLALTAVAGAALLGMSLIGPASSLTSRRAAPAAAERILVTAPTAQLAAALNLLKGPSAFSSARWREQEQRWRELALLAPLPKLEGGVDVIPSQQSRVIANGLDYHARPSFQEYSTYTPALIAANRAFLQGPHAPEWVLFGPESGLGNMTIDHRYPNLAEGALWLDLLHYYRSDLRVGELAVLRRRDVRMPVVLGEPRRVEVGFDETIPVEPLPDAHTEQNVFARIDVRRTFLGRLVAFLYRAPMLTMNVRFADGHEQVYRVVPGIASSGFVLSPLVNNASDFEGMVDGPPPPDRTVTGFSLHISPRMHALFEPRIAIELRSVSVGPSTPRSTPASAWASLIASQTLDPATPSIATAPPSSLNVPVAGLSRVELGFGLALDDETLPGAASVCFAVHPADGSGRTLWDRCLDRGRDADRKPQSMSFELPRDVTEISLETSCRSGCDEGVQSYWSQP